jgi:hypothetical protein
MAGLGLVAAVDVLRRLIAGVFAGAREPETLA